MTYDDLLNEAVNYELVVKEKPLIGNKGRIKGNKIAIKKDMPTIEKACVLAEELGHFKKNVGDILDLRDVRNRKQELKARKWAFDKQIGLIGLIEAFNNSCRSIYEMAEYLDVTEQFLIDALHCYKSKYGQYTKLDNYIIYFEPNLAVYKNFL